MAFYVIIRGPLGIGKSTIAKGIAGKICGKYISVDDILEKLDLDNVEGRSIPLKNFIKVNNYILLLIKKHLEQGKPVILDGNFYFKEQIEDIERKLKFKHYIFNLKASIETCIKRDRGRKKIYGEEAARAVFDLVSRFDYGININTEGKTSEEVVNEIYNSLV